jgi:diguanylate cyclase (GGDEF)-like protein
MVATLRAEGYEILEAENAETGTQLARSAAPEAILLDPRLPNRSGYELYAQLRRDQATNLIPVLFLPTEAGVAERGGDEPERGQGVALGGLDVVTRVGVALRTRTMLAVLRAGGIDGSVAELTDALTGLPNRRALEWLAKLELAESKAAGGSLAAIMVDLDGFARVNEAWGFAVGDHALQAFAGLMHSSVRSADTIGRWDGAGFLMLLPDTGLDAAWHVAERVRQGIEVLGAAFAGMAGAGSAAPGGRQGRPGPETEPEAEADTDVDLDAEGGEVEVGTGTTRPGAAPEAALLLSASLGVAERDPSDEWEDLLERARVALARAKRAGRNRTAVA